MPPRPPRAPPSPAPPPPSGTLARRDNATDEEVAIALLHDVGKAVNIPNHGAIGAELIRPYVSDDAYHAIYNHQHWYSR